MIQLIQDNIALTLAIGSLVYCVALGIYRLFFHPLSKFPGPKLAAITLWYEAYYDLALHGQYTNKIAQLHKQYGPIIRISPHELHVSDPTFYEKLYRQDGHWDKNAWMWEHGWGIPLSAVMTAAHSAHKKSRQQLNPFFSKANVVNRIDVVTIQVSKLHQRITKAATTHASINLGRGISAMTTDVATRFVLGKSYGNLDREDFGGAITEMLQQGGDTWRFSKHFPQVGRLIRSVPLEFFQKIGDEKTKNFLTFFLDVRKEVNRLAATFKDDEIAERQKFSNLIHSILATPNISPAQKSIRRLEDEIDSIVGAGIETIAFTLRLIVFYLYSDIPLLTRLRSVIKQQQANLAPGQDFKLAQLEQIHLLTAVIMEGLRLSPGLATRLSRIAPDRDLIYAETWTIPAGTPVGMTTILMHNDEKLYPDPRHFNPDRWVDFEQRRGEVSKTFGPFGRGTRMCLGMHLAWAELYFTIAMLVLNFDFDLLDTTSAEVDFYSDQFVLGVKSHKGVNVVPYLVS